MVWAISLETSPNGPQLDIRCLAVLVNLSCCKSGWHQELSVTVEQFDLRATY